MRNDNGLRENKLARGRKQQDWQMCAMDMYDLYPTLMGAFLAALGSTSLLGERTYAC